MANPTKAELLSRIAAMKAASTAPSETPVDALVRALAALVADPERSRDVKHLFYSQNGGLIQMSLDMHGDVV